MRFSSLAATLGGLCAARAQIISSKDPQPPSKYPIGAVKEPFAKVSGRLFNVNGTVGYFSGTNAWYLGHLMSNDDVLHSLKQIAETGYKIIRVWGFGDVMRIPRTTLQDPERVWYHYINTTGGYINYGEDGLERFDFLVSTCEQMGLKLVVPFVNNWPEWGGMGYYNQVYAWNQDVLFYHIDKAQEVFRDYIKVLVSRYKNSTAIFSWQLANEPRAEGRSTTSIVYDWAKNVSAYIKSLDPDHMVSLGDEGWLTEKDGVGDGGWGYNGYNGVSFTDNLQIPTLDYGTFHLYPSWWEYPYSWGAQWIKEHDDIGAKYNKPVVIEEYGSPTPREHIKNQASWQEAILKSGLAADQIWQFTPTNTPNVDYKLLGNEWSIYYGDDEWKILGLQHAQNMLKKKVAGPAT